MKFNPDLKLTYKNHRNRLCKIIRFAKQLYSMHSNLIILSFKYIQKQKSSALHSL